MGLAPVGAGWFKLLPNLINLRQTRTMRLMLWPLLLRPLERRRNKDRPRHDRCHVVMVQRHTLSLVAHVCYNSYTMFCDEQADYFVNVGV